jgi:hypothetical protein
MPKPQTYHHNFVTAEKILNKKTKSFLPWRIKKNCKELNFYQEAKRLLSFRAILKMTFNHSTKSAFCQDVARVLFLDLAIMPFYFNSRKYLYHKKNPAIGIFFIEN